MKEYDAHELIERSLRGELDGEERAYLDRAMAADSELAASYDDARAVRAIFHRAGALTCPDSVSENILAAIDAEATPHSITRAPSARRITPQRAGWGLAIAAAIAVLAIIAPARLQIVPTTNQLSMAEIETTRAEVELAFSILNRALARTSHIVDDELRDNVVRPVFENFGRRDPEIIPQPSAPVPSTTAPAVGDDNRQSRFGSPPRDDC
jgi:anti-sigma factor RsiW